MRSKSSVVSVVVMVVLAAIVIIVATTGFIQRAKEHGAALQNVTAFRILCANLTANMCELSKMDEEWINAFLQECRWESGNESITPEDCKKKCGCTEAMEDVFQMLARNTGIKCSSPSFCEATQAGMYAKMVSLANQGIGEGERVYFIDENGLYYDCFKIIDDSFFIKFSDDSSEDCGGLGCSLESSTIGSGIGSKEVKYASSKYGERVYIRQTGYEWKCENCDLFKITERSYSFTVTKIEKPWPWGSQKIYFKLEPCGEFVPFADVEVYVNEQPAKFGDEIHGYCGWAACRFSTSLSFTYRGNPANENERGNVTVVFYFELPEGESEPEIKSIDTDAKILGEASDGKYRYEIFRCENLKNGEKCSINFVLKKIKGKAEKIEAGVRYFVNSNEKTQCEGFESVLTYPEEIACKCPDKILSESREDILALLSNCKTLGGSFTFIIP